MSQQPPSRARTCYVHFEYTFHQALYTIAAGKEYRP